MMILHHGWRSSASRRVRLCLAEKGLAYEGHVVDMARMEHHSPEYLKINPLGVIPTLIHDGKPLHESGTICDYLDATHKANPFVPSNPADRAHVLALALTVACDIHPLNNLRILKYLTGELGVANDAKDEWYRHWVIDGLTALEALAAPRAGNFLFGDAPTLADICLIPQLYNARRFAVSILPFPTLRRVDETASAHPAFAAAHPDRQAAAKEIA